MPLPYRLLVLMGLLSLGACDGSADHATPSGSRPSAKTSVASLTTIRSDSITLPADDATFGTGAQAQLLNGKCLACHSVTMIRYQPPMNVKQWTATVDKMREAYHAPIAPEETGAVVDALMALAPARR